MFKRLIITVVLINIAVANVSKIRYLRDYLDSLDKPTNLIVWKNCFNDQEKVEIIRNSFIPTTFTDADSLNASDFKLNPQHCLFIMDLTCFEAFEEINKKVNLSTFASIMITTKQ